MPSEHQQGVADATSTASAQKNPSTPAADAPAHDTAARTPHIGAPQPCGSAGGDAQQHVACVPDASHAELLRGAKVYPASSDDWWLGTDTLGGASVMVADAVAGVDSAAGGGALATGPAGTLDSGPATVSDAAGSGAASGGDVGGNAVTGGAVGSGVTSGDTFGTFGSGARAASGGVPDCDAARAGRNADGNAGATIAARKRKRSSSLAKELRCLALGQPIVSGKRTVKSPPQESAPQQAPRARSAPLKRQVLPTAPRARKAGACLSAPVVAAAHGVAAHAATATPEARRQKPASAVGSAKARRADPVVKNIWRPYECALCGRCHMPCRSSSRARNRCGAPHSEHEPHASHKRHV